MTTFDMIPSSPVGTRILDRLVGDGFAGERPLTDISEAALYRVVFDAALEVSSQKWTCWPGRDDPWEARAAAVDVDRLAHAIPTCAAARWWSRGTAERPQVWLGRVAAAPTAGVRARHIEGKPRTEIWTSSAVEGMPSAWWPYVEGGGDEGPDAKQSIWRITPHPEARVFEIRTPADWAWLCEAFPGTVVDGRIGPGWDAASEVFDGIHLTVEGLIRVQGLEIETTRGPAMLDNWDAESTAWLRWSVVDLERLGTVTAAVRRGRASPRARRGS